MTGRAFTLKTAADAFQPLSHIRQAIARRQRLLERINKATSVVRDDDIEAARFDRESDFDLRSMRVFDHVVEGFFEREEKMMPRISSQQPRRQRRQPRPAEPALPTPEPTPTPPKRRCNPPPNREQPEGPHPRRPVVQPFAPTPSSRALPPARGGRER